ncbi:unnamed protein product, partial [marine sediment metagenome]
MGRKRIHPKHKQKKPKWYQREDSQSGNFVFDWSLGLAGETWREIFAILILICSVVVFLGFFGSAGNFGQFFSSTAKKVFGEFISYIFTIVFFYTGIVLLIPSKKYRLSRFIGLFLFLISLSVLFHLFVAPDLSQEAATVGKGGGKIGHLLSNPLKNSIGLFPSFLFSVTLVVISFLMIFNFSITKFLGLSAEEEKDDKDISQEEKLSL